MDRVNPVYIRRNHLVEEALTAATHGDIAPFRRLVEVVASPFVERPGLERYAEPAPPGLHCLQPRPWRRCRRAHKPSPPTLKGAAPT
jgi:uncharacterized protein YdiU (UPF0061 family)